MGDKRRISSPGVDEPKRVRVEDEESGDGTVSETVVETGEADSEVPVNETVEKVPESETNSGSKPKGAQDAAVDGPKKTEDTAEPTQTVEGAEDEAEAGTDAKAETQPAGSGDTLADVSSRTQSDAASPDEEPAGASKDPKDSTDSTDTKSSDTKPAIFSTFGSKFAFGGSNGFGSSTTSAFGAFGSSALNKTTDPAANPWAEPNAKSKDQSKPEGPGGQNAEERDSGPVETSLSDPPKITDAPGTKTDRYAQVTLTKQEVLTGEEEESGVFTSRARLYALSLEDTAGGWKERGVGILHLNVITGSTKARIVMRADGLLRLVLNLPLVANTTVALGHSSSNAPEKFVRITGSEGTVPTQFAIKLPSKEVATEFYEQVSEQLSKV